MMAGWLSPSVDVPAIDKIQLAWDVQMVKTVFGATVGGVYLYLTPTVDLLVGPVFFFDYALQPGGAHTLWPVQLDADVPLHSR
jgi:hypothetical protein